MKRILWAAPAAFLIAPWALAQQHAVPEKAKAELSALIAHSKVVGVESMALSSPVTGAPYSAEEVTTFSQTLGDGTRIQRENKVSVYRDSQGRVRRETPGQITIMDPSAGASYILDPKAMTARKISVSVIRHESGNTVLRDVLITRGEGPAAPVMLKHEAAPGGPQQVTISHSAATPAQPGAISHSSNDPAAAREIRVVTSVAGAGAPLPPPPPTPLGFNATTNVLYSTVTHAQSAPAESLGQQSIEGIMSEGTRTTATIAAGEIGNDRPIQVVNERWYSPELKIVTMTRRSDPRTGDETFRLANVRRSEPDAALFQLPAGYQVQGK